MHTLIEGVIFLSLVLGGNATLKNLNMIIPWSQRRKLQLLILALPFFPFGFSLFCLYHFVEHLCLAGDPLWDELLASMLALLTSTLLLGALLKALLSIFLMRRFLSSYRQRATPDIHQRVDRLVGGRYTRPIRVCLLPIHHPIAFTCGFFRPVIFLSPWMIHQLDTHELNAVLAHEVEHVIRRDYGVLFLATFLRDAFLYLPSSHQSYHHLQREKELACDEQAASTTQRPLALASALTRVWLHGTSEGHSFSMGLGQPLLPQHSAMKYRAERLLEVPSPLPPQRSNRYRWNISGIGLLVLIQIAFFFFGMKLIGCNPEMVIMHLLQH
ncbi:M56 family metallopeptidase [Dictyobacter aurantiacus]|uniref:Peptidase M56 domain-containing protein n=1 Tax=Dictyobacter aurantiacus TaxID=1936993 RepID=A0A401Z9A9_9CHLR|nr:M56 family metallopeptidase [Dictyobacter aurantiacus]GCE03413.1 hypothetical protein KDAU_07420 [Dictyobacter aurantiacus]